MFYTSFAKCIPKWFWGVFFGLFVCFFNMIVNGIFLIYFQIVHCECIEIVYFGILILYPTTLLNSLIVIIVF